MCLFSLALQAATSEEINSILTNPKKCSSWCNINAVAENPEIACGVCYDICNKIAAPARTHTSDAGRVKYSPEGLAFRMIRKCGSPEERLSYFLTKKITLEKGKFLFANEAKQKLLRITKALDKQIAKLNQTITQQTTKTDQSTQQIIVLNKQIATLQKKLKQRDGKGSPDTFNAQSKLLAQSLDDLQKQYTTLEEECTDQVSELQKNLQLITTGLQQSNEEKKSCLNQMGQLKKTIAQVTKVPIGVAENCKQDLKKFIQQFNEDGADMIIQLGLVTPQVGSSGQMILPSNFAKELQRVNEHVNKLLAAIPNLDDEECSKTVNQIIGLSPEGIVIKDQLALQTVSAMIDNILQEYNTKNLVQAGKMFDAFKQDFILLVGQRSPQLGKAYQQKLLNLKSKLAQSQKQVLEQTASLNETKKALTSMQELLQMQTTDSKEDVDSIVNLQKTVSQLLKVVQDKDRTIATMQSMLDETLLQPAPQPIEQPDPYREPGAFKMVPTRDGVKYFPIQSEAAYVEPVSTAIEWPSYLKWLQPLTSEQKEIMKASQPIEIPAWKPRWPKFTDAMPLTQEHKLRPIAQLPKPAPIVQQPQAPQPKIAKPVKKRFRDDFDIDPIGFAAYE